jgi:hypothetical protein
VPAGTITVAGYEFDLFREFERWATSASPRASRFAQRDDDDLEVFGQTFAGATGRSVRG